MQTAARVITQTVATGLKASRKVRPSVNLHYAFEPAKGTAQKKMIMIHGMMGDHSYFRKMCTVPTLKSRAASYMIDLRNHGQSPKTETMNMEEMVEDVVELIKQEEIEKPILFGHSFGGMVAMHLALKHPELISSLIIEDVAPVNYLLPGDQQSPVVELLQSIQQTVALDLNRSYPEISAEVHECLKDPQRARFVLKNLEVNPETGFFRWRPNVAVILNYFKSLVGSEFSGTFEGPIHVIKGEKSKFVNPSMYEEFLRYFPNFDPNIDLTTISNAGHWVHHDKPVEFMNCLTEVLDKLPNIALHAIPDVYFKL